MISTVRQSGGSSGAKKARNENGNADSYDDANREGTPRRNENENVANAQAE